VYTLGRCRRRSARRIYVYDASRQRLHEVDSPQDLGDWLADGLYVDAMRALGQKPVLHLGQAR
jgi:hypothetical protein